MRFFVLAALRRMPPSLSCAPLKRIPNPGRYCQPVARSVRTGRRRSRTLLPRWHRATVTFHHRGWLLQLHVRLRNEHEVRIESFFTLNPDLLTMRLLSVAILYDAAFLLVCVKRLSPTVVRH